MHHEILNIVQKIKSCMHEMYKMAFVIILSIAIIYSLSLWIQSSSLPSQILTTKLFKNAFGQELMIVLKYL
jgi:hypothetical protein